MFTFKEMIEAAIRYQPMVLAEDQRQGAPLCYYEKGVFIIKYPDGTLEKHDKPCLPKMRLAHA